MEISLPFKKLFYKIRRQIRVGQTKQFNMARAWEFRGRRRVSSRNKRDLKRYCWKTLSMRPHRSVVLGCSDFIYISRRSLQRSIRDEVKWLFWQTNSQRNMWVGPENRDKDSRMEDQLKGDWKSPALNYAAAVRMGRQGKMQRSWIKWELRRCHWIFTLSGALIIFRRVKKWKTEITELINRNSGNV